MDKITTENDLDRLLQLLEHAAEATPLGNDVPEEADAREQGKGAGSTIDEIDGAPADRVVTPASPEPLEPVDGEDIPTNIDVTEDPGESSDTGPAPAVVDIEKQASALADKLDHIAGSLLHEAAAIIVADIAVKHQAEADAELTAQVAAAVETELDVEPEVAATLAEGLVSEEISVEEYEQLKEAKDTLSELSADMEVDPEEVLASAAEVGQTVLDRGQDADTAVEEALGNLKQAAIEAAMPQLEAAYNKAALVAKKAAAENNPFKARQARAEMERIAHLAEAMTSEEIPTDEELPTDEEIPPGEGETDVEEEGADTASDEVSADSGDVAEGEGMGADAEAEAEAAALAEGDGEPVADEELPPEAGELTPEQQAQAAMVQQAIDELSGVGPDGQPVEGGPPVSEDVLRQAYADTVAGKPMPNLHYASADALLEQNPLGYARLYLESAVKEAMKIGQ